MPLLDTIKSKISSYLENKKSAIKKGFKARFASKSVIDEFNKIVAAHEHLKHPPKSETKISPIDEFKQISESIELRVILNNHQDMIKASISPFKHPEALNRYFRDITKTIKCGEALSSQTHHQSRCIGNAPINIH
jgi:hypothetical protein